MYIRNVCIFSNESIMIIYDIYDNSRLVFKEHSSII